MNRFFCFVIKLHVRHFQCSDLSLTKSLQMLQCFNLLVTLASSSLHSAQTDQLPKPPPFMLKLFSTSRLPSCTSHSAVALSYTEAAVQFSPTIAVLTISMLAFWRIWYLTLLENGEWGKKKILLFQLLTRNSDCYSLFKIIEIVYNQHQIESQHQTDQKSEIFQSKLLSGSMFHLNPQPSSII